MNVKERDEWLKALGACFPNLTTGAMSSACAAVAEEGRWEASVRGGELTAAGLRFQPARRGAPRLDATWDLTTGRPIGGAPFSPAAPGRRVRFKAGLFGEPALDKVIADFAALCPVDSMVLREVGWSLVLASPPRWPLFARCDIAAVFTPSASQLALFLLDRRVSELSFDGEALWAHCGG